MKLFLFRRTCETKNPLVRLGHHVAKIYKHFVTFQSFSLLDDKLSRASRSLHRGLLARSPMKRAWSPRKLAFNFQANKRLRKVTQIFTFQHDKSPATNFMLSVKKTVVQTAPLFPRTYKIQTTDINRLSVLLKLDSYFRLLYYEFRQRGSPICQLSLVSVYWLSNHKLSGMSKWNNMRAPNNQSSKEFNKSQGSSHLVWDPHQLTRIKTLEAVQNNGARYVNQDWDRHTSVTTMKKTSVGSHSRKDAWF